MKIRNTQDSDSEAIAKISITGWRYAYKGILEDSLLSSLNIEQRSEGWLKAFQSNFFKSFVAVIDSEIVGFIDFGKLRKSEIDEAGEVLAIYVNPSLIGNGIGSNLLEAALKELLSEGFITCSLWVLEKNSIGRRFYEYKGFKSVGTTKQLGSTEIKEIMYFKDLKKSV